MHWGMIELLGSQLRMGRCASYQASQFTQLPASTRYLIISFHPKLPAFPLQPHSKIHCHLHPLITKTIYSQLLLTGRRHRHSPTLTTPQNRHLTLRAQPTPPPSLLPVAEPPRPTYNSPQKAPSHPSHIALSITQLETVVGDRT